MINNALSEQGADFESHSTDCMGLEEESDHEQSDVSCHEKVDTESLLFSHLRRRLVDRLRTRRTQPISMMMIQWLMTLTL